MNQTAGVDKVFLYLIQGKGVLPSSYSTIENDRSDVLHLTWKDKLEGSIYFPKSTWTEGRNKLLSEALKINKPYMYYIFLDDDIMFQKGNWKDFEDELLKYQPAVATPYLIGYPHNIDTDMLAQTCFMFDAMYNAFHKDILKDKFMLPYFPGFDKKSWWYSQSFVIHLMHLFYPNHILQINTVRIENSFHGEYPRSSSFTEGSQWFYRHVLRSKSRHAFLKANQTVHEPSEKLNSYCVPIAIRKEKVKIHSTYWNYETAIGKILWPMSKFVYGKMMYWITMGIKKVI
jgi:hypothetical protein